MPIELVSIATERFPAWLERSREEYTADLIATGENPEQARLHATESLSRAFPENAPTADNAVLDLVDESGNAVGYLWVGRDNSDDASSWWVWDVVVYPEHRGKGFGREAMLLAEGYARDRGAQTLGLSVFGFNAAARALYDSLGYETTSVKMRKRL